MIPAREAGQSFGSPEALQKDPERCEKGPRFFALSPSQNKDSYLTQAAGPGRARMRDTCLGVLPTSQRH